jgi:hypothetical protein
MSSFTLDLTIKDFDFKFFNYKNDYKKGTRIELTYEYAKFDSGYTYSGKYDSFLIKGFLKKRYELRENEKELENFKKAQTTAVTRLKFYEDHGTNLKNIIQRSAFKHPIPTFDFIYGFKKYIPCINNYKKEDMKDYLSKILECFDEDMQFSKIYNFKLLKFQKLEKNYVNITMNKSFCCEVYTPSIRKLIQNDEFERLDSIFDIIIPVIQEIGGINELKNVILHDRILTE